MLKQHFQVSDSLSCVCTTCLSLVLFFLKALSYTGMTASSPRLISVHPSNLSRKKCLSPNIHMKTPEKTLVLLGSSAHHLAQSLCPRAKVTYGLPPDPCPLSLTVCSEWDTMINHLSRSGVWRGWFPQERDADWQKQRVNHGVYC